MCEPQFSGGVLRPVRRARPGVQQSSPALAAGAVGARTC